MPVTGAYAKLGKVVSELAALGDAKTMEMAGRNVGQAVLSEVQLGFRNEVSPNDVPWVKRKRPRKRNKGWASCSETPVASAPASLRWLPALR